jgi:putative nucleotidyltransferase with HDIG domain
MREEIDKVLKDITKLPPMSNVVLRVMTLIQNPSVSIQELANEISKDPAVTATIIKLSNSAYYRASKPIRTVSESLMTLGIKTVKEIILLSASKKIISKDLPAYQIEADAMWLHSLIVAELSAKISTLKKTNIARDLAFTSGLLHDIGKVILAQFFPAKILEIKAAVKNSEKPFTDIEKEFLGYDHQEVGNKALEAWNFPDELKEVVLYHHNFEGAKKFPKLVACVHIANHISVISGIGIDIGGLSHELSKEAVDILGITEADLTNLYTTLPELQKSISELQTL